MTEVEKLLYENEKLKNQLKDSQHCINVYSHTITQLSKENEKLKNRIAELQAWVGRIISIHTQGGLSEEVIKLKEENDSLKETIESLRRQIRRYSGLVDYMSDKLKVAEKLTEQLFIYPLTPEQSFRSKKEEVKPYYYKKDEKGKCLEYCHTLNNGTKIGSISCIECDNCLSSHAESANLGFIKCKLMPEGKAKVEPKKEEVKPEPEVKPYYYTVSDSTCIEKCKFNLTFHGVTIKIGSSACGECGHCKEIDYKNYFVKCKLMPDGKAKVEPKQEEPKQKRDEFGIIGVTENLGVCKDCIYKEYSSFSKECTHCITELEIDEYYISK